MIETASTQTFLSPPTFRVALTERDRLLQLLRLSAECRVVLIDAPAGYGKTWLLGRRYAELRASGARVVWVGIEEADAAQFLTMLVASLARAGVDIGPIEAMAAQGFADVPLTAAVRTLCAALAASTTPVIMFVDDMHRLERPALHDVLARLVVEAPASTRFLCSGRDGSGLQRAALRARGDLREIGVEELRFAYDEAQELLPHLQTEQIHRLIDRTEGWPVALQLARLWLDAKPERLALLDAFSGRTTEVAEYLTEQVLSDLSSDLQRIVFDIAVLDALNPDLVAAVTGSQQTWARLIEDGRLEHFLVPLDEERYWFRLHHLLLDYLRGRRREQGSDGRELHSRATGWFERHGRVREAVRHAVLADDIPRAVALVERTGGWELVLFGGISLMRALLNSLPFERVAEFPRVQLYHAFLAAKDGDLARGIRLYQVVAGAGLANVQLERDLLISGHLIFRYADRPVGPDELAALYREYEALPTTDEVARATLLNSACLLAFRVGAMSEALEACMRSVREMRRIGSVLGVNYCLFHLGLAQLHGGERREAEATLIEAAAMAEENFGADSGLKAIADVYLALALHARGDVAEAAERLAASLGQVEATDGWFDLYAEAYEVAIANAIARGDRAAAAAVTERMTLTAARRGLERLERLAVASRAQTTALLAQLPGAKEGEAARSLETLLDAGGLEWQRGAWRAAPSIWREHHAFGMVRVLMALARGQPREAAAILDDLELAARAGQRRRHLRVLGTIRAAIHLQLDEPDTAIALFAPHLESAISEDDTQYLVDLGPVLLPLLQKTWIWSREHGSSARVRHVLGAVVAALGRAATAGDMPGSLSERELEVLLELASGAPNKIIARRLQMTENTVKFHLKRVFQKLQVRHRSEAIQAGRSRGLLP
jgi:LuxR family maltose regulon positive regulatory protein